jgi:hypothetical protein
MIVKINPKPLITETVLAALAVSNALAGRAG